MKIVLRGDSDRGYVDGQLLADVKDSSRPTAWRIWPARTTGTCSTT